jgi:hypothetical protein
MVATVPTLFQGIQPTLTEANSDDDLGCIYLLRLVAMSQIQTVAGCLGGNVAEKMLGKETFVFSRNVLELANRPTAWILGPSQPERSSMSIVKTLRVSPYGLLRPGYHCFVWLNGKGWIVSLAFIIL